MSSLQDLGLSVEAIVTIIGLFISLIYYYHKAREPLKDARRLDLRCNYLIKYISDNIDYYYTSILDITGCLEMPRDEQDITQILFSYSNKIAELQDFMEKGCPEIVEEAEDIYINNARSSIAAGAFSAILIYLAYTEDYIPFIVLGFAYLILSIFQLLYRSRREATEYIHERDRYLSDIAYKITTVEKNLRRLEQKCLSKSRPWPGSFTPTLSRPEIKE